VVKTPGHWRTPGRWREGGCCSNQKPDPQISRNFGGTLLKEEVEAMAGLRDRAFDFAKA
jgi:hypothetical protein